MPPTFLFWPTKFVKLTLFQAIQWPYPAFSTNTHACTCLCVRTHRENPRPVTLIYRHLVQSPNFDHQNLFRKSKKLYWLTYSRVLGDCMWTRTKHWVFCGIKMISVCEVLTQRALKRFCNKSLWKALKHVNWTFYTNSPVIAFCLDKVVVSSSQLCVCYLHPNSPAVSLSQPGMSRIVGNKLHKPENVISAWISLKADTYCDSHKSSGLVVAIKMNVQLYTDKKKFQHFITP